jgi:hypothetical protein
MTTKIAPSSAKAVPFARPILEKHRPAFPKGCPAATETMQWNTPFFEKDGRVGGIAAFKDQVSFTLWMGRDVDDPLGLFGGVGNTSRSSVKIATVKDLPTQALLREYVDWSSEATGAQRALDQRRQAQELEVRELLAASRAAASESSATGDGWVRTGSLPPRP